MPPSDLHMNLTKRVRGWMRRRATGVGIDYASEVYLAESYVADAVVIGSLQHRFWLEVTRSSIEEFRALGSRDRVMVPEKLVMVFETKVSRSDFMCTFNVNGERNRSTPIGNLHYLVTPPGLKCDDHLPDWWGLLEQSGNGLRQIRPARYGAIEEAQLWHAAFRVLLAQHRNPRCFICLSQTADEPSDMQGKYIGDEF